MFIRLINREKLKKELKGISAYHVSRNLLIVFILFNYLIGEKISPEKIETVLQAHAEGSSLRGISRTTKLAYNTFIEVVRYTATKAQMIHNEELIDVNI